MTRTGMLRHTYDANSRLATRWSKAKNTTSYTYDNVGNLTFVNYPSSQDLTFAYDALNRLTNMVDAAGTTKYTYSAAGDLLTEDNPWSSTDTVTYSYHSSVPHLQTGLTLQQPSGNWSQSYQQTRTDASYVNYTYDNASELKTAVGTGGQSTENLGYTYDPAWNMSQRTNNGTPVTYTLNSLNQVTSDGSNSYTYDYNGNRGTCGSLYYGYDDENQLTYVFLYNTWRTEFVYDGRGRLRIRKEFTWMGSGWYPNGEIRYLYDGMRVIQERNSSIVPTVAYTRGNDLSGSLEGGGGIVGLLARSDTYSGGNFTRHHCYHADGNGNITALIDSAQAVAATYRYDPYGRSLGTSGSMANPNVYRFSSKELMSNSGLYYYGYRFYDPNIQRWLNRDPIGERGGINLYGFVNNGPVSVVDRLGLDSGPIPHGPGDDWERGANLKDCLFAAQQRLFKRRMAITGRLGREGLSPLAYCFHVIGGFAHGVQIAIGAGGASKRWEEASALYDMDCLWCYIEWGAIFPREWVLPVGGSPTR